MNTSILKRQGTYLIATVFTFFAAACNNEGNGDNTDFDTTQSETAMDNVKDTNSSAMVEHAEAMISGTNSDTTVEGSAKFEMSNGQVKLVIDLKIPKEANKSVAVHIHENGDCGEAGQMAHGHWNPTNQQHGKWGEGSFHLGDIGNIALDGEGEGTMTIETNLWTLGGPAASNVIGHAIIIHSGVDDFKSQPAGNAGSRVGCGVIK